MALFFFEIRLAKDDKDIIMSEHSPIISNKLRFHQFLTQVDSRYHSPKPVDEALALSVCDLGMRRACNYPLFGCMLYCYVEREREAKAEVSRASEAFVPIFEFLDCQGCCGGGRGRR